jgi:hypothetical protein
LEDPDQRRAAILCCALLSQHDCCAAEIGTKEFLRTMTHVCRTKDARDKALIRDGARYFSTASSNATVRARILEDQVDEMVRFTKRTKYQRHKAQNPRP